MKAGGCQCEFHYYDGAGHAFMNEGEEAVKTRAGNFGDSFTQHCVCYCN